jgi:hypothetical protein
MLRKIGWGEDQDGWRLDHFAKMMRALRATRWRPGEWSGAGRADHRDAGGDGRTYGLDGQP